MEKVVYILGAGFSAPLGLPVVSNFRLRSQDMYLTEPERYAHFEDVFKALGGMAVTKNYYQADLFNIEEILSILEIDDYLQGNPLKQVFIQYIKDVIVHCTPPIKPYPMTLPSNWEVALFGADEMWKMYGFFMAALLNLRFSRMVVNHTPKDIFCDKDEKPSELYGVITLNYDTILEAIWQFCQDTHTVRNTTLGFAPAITDAMETSVVSGEFEVGAAVSFAKLHGSVDGESIVPPTWNKGSVRGIVPAWKVAHDLLKAATQIRIIGYSLPLGDAYIKYLFKSAATHNRYLKQIDVICLDPDGSVQRRYDDFIQFKNYRFVSDNTVGYLQQNMQQTVHAYEHAKAIRAVGNTANIYISMNRLEAAHAEYMRRTH